MLKCGRCADLLSKSCPLKVKRGTKKAGCWPVMLWIEEFAPVWRSAKSWSYAFVFCLKDHEGEVGKFCVQTTVHLHTCVTFD